jgi:hypothetical protein
MMIIADDVGLNSLIESIVSPISNNSSAACSTYASLLGCVSLKWQVHRF